MWAKVVPYLRDRALHELREIVPLDLHVACNVCALQLVKEGGWERVRQPADDASWMMSADGLNTPVMACEERGGRSRPDEEEERALRHARRVGFLGSFDGAVMVLSSACKQGGGGRT